MLSVFTSGAWRRRRVFTTFLQAANVRTFFRSPVHVISIHVPSEPPAIVLTCGQLYSRERFGTNTVNRGAVLLECEWDGGSFESGLFIAGMFRSGQFLGGIFLGGIFWDGVWVGGEWEGGFDRSGIYRHRGDNPAPR